MQVQRRYHEISHFRAPYKDSVFNGYGVYEMVRGRELHGLGEYLPVSGMGEYERVEGLGEYLPVSGLGAAELSSTLLQAVGGLQFVTDAGAAAVAAMLLPYQTTPNALAVSGTGGDVGVVAWIGEGAPPAEMGTGPFMTLAQILSMYMTGGWVLLSDTQLLAPTPGTRQFILTKNTDTIAKNAHVGGLFFLSPGADPTLVAAAQKRVTALFGKGLLATLGPFGAAGLVLAAGAGLWYVFRGRKDRKGRK